MISAPESTSSKNLPHAAPFDALAPEYDDLWSDSFIGRLQRQQVWQELHTVFRPGERILELGCGTGIDAAHLAGLGIQVHATDISRHMLRAARKRIQRAGLSHRVTFELQSVESLPEIAENGPFDGALSNFGVFNCVRNLEAVASRLAHLVRPGGRVAICWMGRFCLWETIWLLFHGRPSKALRRLRARASGVLAILKPGFEVPVFYPSVAGLVAAFRRHFHLISCRGVGMLVPPSYVGNWASTKRAAFERMARLDEFLGRWPIMRSIGDHRLAVFKRIVPDLEG